MFSKITKCLFAAIILACTVQAQAQEVTLEGVTARGFTGVKSINGEFYYTFYFGEKTETKGMANFVLALYDANLTPVKTAEVEISKDSRLTASSFNGQHFLFMFSDLVRRKRTTVTMDKDGNVVKNNVEEKVKSALLTADNDPVIHPMGDNFIVIAPQREKKFGYEISLVDKDQAAKWTKSFFPDKGSWSVEDSRMTAGNLYLLRKEKESMMGDKYTYTVQSIKLDNGDEVYATEVKDEDDGGFPDFINVNADGSIATGGMYFKNSKYDEKNSDGIFFALIGQDGAITKMSKTSWKKVKDQIKGDFSGALVGGKTKVLVEDLIQKKDGTYMVISETFRKGSVGTTGAGAVSKLGGLSGTASKGDAGDKGFTVMDFAMFHFDANGELTAIDKVEKATKEAIVKGDLADMNGLEMAQSLSKRKFFCYRNTIEVNGKQYIMYKNLDGYKTKAYFLPVGSTSTAGIGSIDMDKWVPEALNKVGKIAKWTGDGVKAEFGNEGFGDGGNPELYKNIIPAKAGHVLLYQFFNGKLAIWLEKIPTN